MRAARLLPVIAVALTVAGCLPREEVIWGIDTRVVDYTTRQPISGATVSLLRDGKVPRLATSDAAGHVHIDPVTERIWMPIYGDFFVIERVRTEADGYEPIETETLGANLDVIALLPRRPK